MHIMKKESIITLSVSLGLAVISGASIVNLNYVKRHPETTAYLIEPSIENFLDDGEIYSYITMQLGWFSHHEVKFYDSESILRDALKEVRVMYIGEKTGPKYEFHTHTENFTAFFNSDCSEIYVGKNSKIKEDYDLRCYCYALSDSSALTIYNALYESIYNDIIDYEDYIYNRNIPDIEDIVTGISMKAFYEDDDNSLTVYEDGYNIASTIVETPYVYTYHVDINEYIDSTYTLYNTDTIKIIFNNDCSRMYLSRVGYENKGYNAYTYSSWNASTLLNAIRTGIFDEYERKVLELSEDK